MGYFDDIPTKGQKTSTTTSGGYFDDIPVQKKSNVLNTIKSTGKEIAKSVLKLPARAATNVAQFAQGVSKLPEVLRTGKTTITPVKPFSGKFLGDVTSIGTSGNIKKDILDISGSAVEAASYLPFAGVVKGGYTVGKALVIGGKEVVKQSLKGMAIDGAVGGFTGSLGQQLQEKAQTGRDISLTEAGKSGVFGAVAAPALGLLGRGIGKIFNRGEVPVASAVADEIVPQVNTVPFTKSTQTTNTDVLSSIINNGKKAPELAHQAVEQVVPETFTPSLATRVEADAVEKGLVTKFEGLPEAQTMNMRQQADDAVNLVNNNYEQAKRVALGTENAPGDLRDASVFEAVKFKALKDGDVATLKQLATESTVPARISAAAQQVKAADARLLDSTDPVELMQTVMKAREKGVQLKQRVVKNADTAQVKQIIKKSVPKRQDWDEFINSIQC